MALGLTEWNSTGNEIGRNVIIFGVDMNSWAKIDQFLVKVLHKD